jgi:hypothetical protein
MRPLLIVGLLLLVLGIASLIVPIPRKERHGIDAGPVSIGVTTTTREKVHPAVSAVLIGAGALLAGASAMRRR